MMKVIMRNLSNNLRGNTYIRLDNQKLIVDWLVLIE